jgi:hypothetical protein
MTRRERLQRTIITVLTLVLISTLGVGGVLVYRYKQQNTALTKCYGVADSAMFFILAAESEHAGNMDTARSQRDYANGALNALNEDDLVEAMEACDYAFWVE